MRCVSFRGASAVFVAVAVAAAALGASSGCVYHHEASGSSNGNGSVLSFQATDSSDLRNQVSVVGATRLVEVRYIPSASVECRRLGKLNAGAGLTLQGGSGPDLSDRCARAPAAPITVESVSCADAACEVTSDPLAARGVAGPGLLLRVVAKREGLVRLDVTVKSQDDGVSHADSIDLEFAIAKRIRVSGTTAALLPFRLPVLPGVGFVAPRAAVVDANERVLVVDVDLSKPAIGGNAIALDEDERGLMARTAGRATLRWEIPNVLSRALEVEVVGADKAESLMVLTPDATSPRAIDATKSVDFDSPVTLSDAAAASIDLTMAAGHGVMFATRARLHDGRAALAKLTMVEVAPAVFARFELDLFAPWSFYVADLPAVGEGSVVLHAGAVSATIPLRVSPAR